MTSPYQFYQFWINADDADLPKFIRYFTLKSKEDVEQLEKEYANDPQTLKRILAEELTVRIHSRADYESVLKVTELLFNKRANADFLKSMSAAELETVGGEIPGFKITKHDFGNELNIVDLLAGKTAIVNSNGDARRAIKGNAISVNKEKINTHEAVISDDQLLHGRFLMVENGKKNKFLIEVLSS
jgi:tyrosyl-tRNA synthetase